jgi:hypothetical protein
MNDNQKCNMDISRVGLVPIPSSCYLKCGSERGRPESMSAATQGAPKAKGGANRKSFDGAVLKETKLVAS